MLEELNRSDSVYHNDPAFLFIHTEKIIDRKYVPYIHVKHFTGVTYSQSTIFHLILHVFVPTIEIYVYYFKNAMVLNTISMVSPVFF